MSDMTVEEAVGKICALQKEIGKVIVGMDEAIESVLICLFCDGNVLLEGAPGLGKTLLLKTLARATSLDCKRVSFAADILPGDLVGVEMFDPTMLRTRLVEEGPIFTNLFFADEINRASAKSKSRILEAMEERQVSVGGAKLALPKPFMVMATQNPLEIEGTYSPSRVEVDRLFMRVAVQYPSFEDELEIARRYSVQKPEDIAVAQVMDAQTVLDIRNAIYTMHTESRIIELAVRITRATRPEQDDDADIIMNFGGGSPRAYLSLIKAARAHAALRGRSFVSPDDLRSVALRVLCHRLVPKLGVEDEEQTIPEFVKKVCDKVLGGEK